MYFSLGLRLSHVYETGVGIWNELHDIIFVFVCKKIEEGYNLLN